MTAGLLLDGVAPPLPDRRRADPVDVLVAPGTSLAVTGPSGVGKTTMLGVVAGLVGPALGTVRLDGVAVTVGDVAHARRIGYLQQGFGLVSTLTARENLLAVLLDRPDRRREAVTDAAAVIAAVDLDDVADLRVDRLSGGQQQRVALARALVVRPRLLLADEPTSELDAAMRAKVLDLVFDHSPDRVVVVATHDPLVAARCDAVLVLQVGGTHAAAGRSEKLAQHRATVADDP